MNDATVFVRMEKNAVDSSVSIIEALTRIRDVFEDFCHRASEITALENVQLDVSGSDPLAQLRQANCEITTALEAAEPSVRLGVALMADKPPVLVYRQEVSDFLSYLKGAGLTLRSSRKTGLNSSQQQTEVELDSKIVATLSFSGSKAEDVIHVRISNYTSLGEVQFKVRSFQVDTRFLEQLHRYLGRSENQLLKLISQSSTEVGESEEITLQSEAASLALQEKTADILDFSAAPAASNATLEISFRDVNLRFDAEHPVCHMGRKFPADILVRSKYVSRDHATLVFENGQFTLHDHSSNGTYVQLDRGILDFLHNEAVILHGGGLISLGVAPEEDLESIIRFDIGEASE